MTIALIIASLLCTLLLIALGVLLVIRHTDRQRRRYVERCEARARRKSLGLRR